MNNEEVVNTKAIGSQEEVVDEDVAIENTRKSLKTYANPSCSQCYGRGHVGFNIITKKFSMCKSKGCAFRNIRDAYVRAQIEQENKEVKDGTDRSSNN